MRYALIDGVREEPQPKLKGVCPGCGEPVIAKCGQHVIWHWAHASRCHCDSWWEKETEWHRSWKDRFPVDWQEVPMRDPVTQELHIADVRTPAGLVLEFQHSNIEPAEVEARGRFYQDLVWVIDGCRNEGDPFNFSNGRGLCKTDGTAVFRWFPRSKLFERWLVDKPVFIDFGPQHGFWRILRYDPNTKTGQVGVVDRSGFVELASSGTTTFSRGGGPATPITHIQR